VAREQIENAFKFIDDNRDSMIALWRDLVDTESGTQCKDDVDALSQKIRAILESEGYACREETFENAGCTLVGESVKDGTGGGVMLLGHMDTVYPRGTVASWPFRIEDGKAYGPGVLDMKAGVAILIFIVKALKEIGYAKRPVKVIISGDEDSGHLRSDAGAVISRETKGLAFGFDFETGFPDHSIAIARKGGATYIMEIEGVGAHSGNAHEKGRSAILEAAHKISEIEKSTDYSKGMTFNVGTIKGGTVVNAVPAAARIEIDVRFPNMEYVKESEEILQKISDTVYVAGTTSKLTRGMFFPPMSKCDATMGLYALAVSAAESTGLPTPKQIAPGGG